MAKGARDRASLARAIRPCVRFAIGPPTIGPAHSRKRCLRNRIPKHDAIPVRHFEATASSCISQSASMDAGIVKLRKIRSTEPQDIAVGSDEGHDIMGTSVGCVRAT